MTHHLQPLDVGVFGPLQHAWFIQCDEILEEMENMMELRDVVAEYIGAMCSIQIRDDPEGVVKSWNKANQS